MKKAILVFKNEELYMALRRAMRSCSNVEITQYKNSYGIKDTPVMYCLDENNGDIETWLWGEFRGRNKARNPLIVLGIEKDKDFIYRNPVFVDHPFTHRYLSAPFHLFDLIAAFEKIKSVYDENTRMFLVSDYGKNYEYKLISHDLKIMLVDKKATLNNFQAVKDFYEGKGDSENSAFLSKLIRDLNMEDDWSKKALEGKNTLLNKLAQKNSL